MTANHTKITVKTTVHASLEKAWECFTAPEHVTQWNAASDDWHCPAATNDLRTGGSFKYTMAARDGSVSFDFEGQYTEVVDHQRIAYVLADDRRIEVLFEADGDAVHITETFDPENENPPEMQKEGWQAILDNYKKHTKTV